jgi:sugar lactone lactonase YvrE
MRLSTIVLDGLEFPEGLRWHSDELWLSDMRSRRVMSVGASGRSTLRAYLPAMPAGIGWLPDGTLLVTSMLDQLIVSIRDGWRWPYQSLTGVAVGQVNDMLVDAHGRAYVGSIGLDLLYEPLDGTGSPMQPVPLALVTPDGSVGVAADGLMCPNGMAVSRDGATFFIAESAARRVLTYAVADDGRLTDPKTLAEFEQMPDGLCIDAEDMIWVALLGEERFVRIDSHGEIVDEISCPGRTAVDCVLGGTDGRTLYGAVTYTPGTAFGATGELSGAIEAWTVDIPGPGW